jgi:hypothetical protein
MPTQTYTDNSKGKSISFPKEPYAMHAIQMHRKLKKLATHLRPIIIL